MLSLLSFLSIITNLFLSNEPKETCFDNQMNVWGITVDSMDLFSYMITQMSTSVEPFNGLPPPKYFMTLLHLRFGTGIETTKVPDTQSICSGNIECMITACKLLSSESIDIVIMKPHIESSEFIHDNSSSVQRVYEPIPEHCGMEDIVVVGLDSNYEYVPRTTFTDGWQTASQFNDIICSIMKNPDVVYVGIAA